MNFRKFLHDARTSTDNYSTEEAADYLNLDIGRVRHLVRIGILVPIEGGGRGRNFYFTEESLQELDEMLEPYR
jgi:DNA-binding transcriptional MerR regulator